MRMSEQIGELVAALSKAQGAMKAAHKDKKNPFFNSTYSTLAAVIEALREPFAANGLAFTQPTYMDGEHVMVETYILHSSGQWIAGVITAKPTKPDPQGVGSLVSYLKRYELQSMAGMSSADEDDDGNAASNGRPAAKTLPKPQAKEALYQGVTAAEKNELSKIAAKLGITKTVDMIDLSKSCIGLEMSQLEAAAKEWKGQQPLI